MSYISGKEIAIYSVNDLLQWNVYGLDNIGYINPDRRRYFYLKDHLGSVRVTLDENRNIVTAYDYDCWDSILEKVSYTIANIFL